MTQSDWASQDRRGIGARGWIWWLRRPQDTIDLRGADHQSFFLTASGNGAERRSEYSNHSGSASSSRLLHNRSLVSQTVLCTGSTATG